MDFVVTNDPGGHVVEYAIRAQDLERRGQRVRIVGRCDSACTLYLAVPGTCVSPRASFGFHLPFTRKHGVNAKATKLMLDTYPLWVRAWLRQEGGLTARIKRMDYSYASKHLRTCS